MNVNKVFVAGRLTRDPALRYLPSNEPIVEFTVAVNWSFPARDGGYKEKTAFVVCRAHGKRAETINERFRKGKEIYVEGRLDYSEWHEGKLPDGSPDTSSPRRTQLAVSVIEFQFVGAANGFDRAEDAQRPQPPQDGPPQQRRPQPRYEPAPRRPGQGQGPQYDEVDIPF